MDHISWSTPNSKYFRIRIFDWCKRSFIGDILLSLEPALQRLIEVSLCHQQYHDSEADPQAYLAYASSKLCELILWPSRPDNGLIFRLMQKKLLVDFSLVWNLFSKGSLQSHSAINNIMIERQIYKESSFIGNHDSRALPSGLLSYRHLLAIPTSD